MAMDKFYEEVEKAGLGSDSIEGMVRRDIEYKADIYKKIHGIKMRQITSLIIGTFILIMMGVILYKVDQNFEAVTYVLKAILYATGLVNTPPAN